MKPKIVVIKEICEQLAEGKPLAEICRAEGMPTRRTVYLWTDADEDLATRIAQARAKGFDAIAEECLQIANTTVEGVQMITRPDGSVEHRRGDMLGHRKLQIETRLKLLAKWDPKRYGDRVTATHEGSLSLVGLVTGSYKAPE